MSRGRGGIGHVTKCEHPLASSGHGIVRLCQRDHEDHGLLKGRAEQLLLTGTSDRAVGSIDFRPLSGHRVYLETSQVSAADSGWVIFGLRREMARQGLLLVSDKKDAQTLIEAALALRDR